jgi:probable phosphoglycerate mutase
MLFFYVRHGDPIYSPDSLTPLGHEQARAVAKRFTAHGLDRIYASSSNRAQLTAKPSCDLLKKKMEILDWANEGFVWQEFTVTLENGQRTWGFYDPRMLELFRSGEMRALGDLWHTHPAIPKSFGEGMARIDREVDEFFLSLGYKHDRENARYEPVAPTNERVALFAHQGFSMAFFSSMLDIPYPVFSTHFDIGHTGMSVIEFEPRGNFVYPKVLQHANDGHLYREGILTGYHNRIKF